MTPELDRIARAIASTPILLVASDYDGTLAPLVEDPAAAAADAGAVQALEALGTLPHTHISVISGRGLADLQVRLRSVPGLLLAGSHGGEIAGAEPMPLSEPLKAALASVSEAIRAHTENCFGSLVESKPRGVAFHYRAVPESRSAPAVQAVIGLKDRFPELTMRLGSMVIEFAADKAAKSDALRVIRDAVGATAVLFVGDDFTDEHAFADLTDRDAGVKIGPGTSRARYRLESLDQVTPLLRRVYELRSAWLGSRRLQPIQSHAVLSDLRTLALVTPSARITWLCLPRLDSPALFAELLGGPSAGYFDITPASPTGPSTQAYLHDALIVRTAWDSVSVTDYFDCAGGRAFQRAGRSDLIRVVEGSGRAIVRFAPRLDFGRVPTKLAARDGALEVEAAQDLIVLYGPGVTWSIAHEGPHQTATAELDLSAGPVSLELRYGTGNVRPHPRSEVERREQTGRFWSAWAGSLRVPPVVPNVVKRSALMLRALCHGPTGALAAAGTTSLPEYLGGARNWDYRYCWPRDAALAAAALLRIGNTGTAMRLLDWLLGVIDRCESPDRLRPIYTVTGSDLGPEAEIGSLAGYAESRPVRIGNAAAQQVQLDVFGPITDLVASLAESGAAVSPDHWRITRAMVQAVEARWQEPDHGIWEIRGPRRHHVHSKAMCFHTVDRATVVQEFVVGKPNPAWIALRERIREDVLAHGFNESVGAFTAEYGSKALDAASLQVGLVGLLDPADDRFRRTVDAVERELRRGPTVYRYRYSDGLPGREGGFHLCTAWLIESFIKLGRLPDAVRLFDELVSLVGPTGLLSEQYDPDIQMPLGNAPQAYSHLSIINCAVLLAAQGHRTA